MENRPQNYGDWDDEFTEADLGVVRKFMRDLDRGANGGDSAAGAGNGQVEKPLRAQDIRTRQPDTTNVGDRAGRGQERGAAKPGSSAQLSALERFLGSI